WSLPRTNKFDDLVHQGISTVLGSHLVNARPKLALSEKQRLISRSHALNVGFGKATTTHSNHIESNQVGQGAMRHPKGYDVGPHPTQSDDHGTFADPHELPYRHAPAENDMIANGYVSAEQNVIGEDHVIANLAVMSHVSTDHDEAVIADFSDPAVVLGAGIHRHVLSYVAIGTNYQSCRSATIAERLGR